MLLMGEEAQGGFGSQNGSTSPEPLEEGGGRRFGGEEERDTAQERAPGRPAWVGGGRRRPGLLASARAAPKAVTVLDAET